MIARASFTVFLMGAIALPTVGLAAATCQVPGLDAKFVHHARQLLDQVPLIDGHNDLPWAIREQVGNRLRKIDLSADLSLAEEPTHTDLGRLERGGMGAQFWSVYVPVDLAGADAVQAVIEQIDVVHRLAEHYPEAFELALSAADVLRIHHEGKVASLIGIEGGHSIGDSLAVLRQLYGIGARYMTITHWRHNNWADAATSKPVHGGLSDFGREVIREMNRLGMLVDLSHVSEATMNATLDIALAPVIFSHSSARGVAAHPRNVPDAVLGRLKENGGVVMVTFVPSFLSEELRQHGAREDAEEARLDTLFIGDPEGRDAALEQWKQAHPAPRATLAHAADHIEHIRRVAGLEQVGIGSDFDGISAVPAGLEDVSCFPALLGELLRRGWTDEDIRQLAGLNLLRVMRRAEAVAGELRAERLSSDVKIDDFATAIDSE